jgi:hypothetical protein
LIYRAAEFGGKKVVDLRYEVKNADYLFRSTLKIAENGVLAISNSYPEILTV